MKVEIKSIARKLTSIDSIWFSISSFGDKAESPGKCSLISLWNVDVHEILLEQYLVIGPTCH